MQSSFSWKYSTNEQVFETKIANVSDNRVYLSFICIRTIKYLHTIKFYQLRSLPNILYAI